MSSADLIKLRDIQQQTIFAGRLCMAARLMVEGVRDELSVPHTEAFCAVLSELGDGLEDACRQIDEWVETLAAGGVGNPDGM